MNEFCQGVLVSGRYGHGKPRKPVNSPLSALHRFQSYIISVCYSEYLKRAIEQSFSHIFILSFSSYRFTHIQTRKLCILSRKPLYYHENSHRGSVIITDFCLVADIGQKLKGIDFDAVYTSDMLRAIHTVPVIHLDGGTRTFRLELGFIRLPEQEAQPSRYSAGKRRISKYGKSAE